MFTSIRSSSAFGSHHSGNNPDLILTLASSTQSVTVTHDGFTIGSNQRCDLVVDDSEVPSLHSIIHIQAGAIWIEACSDDATLLVNDRLARRMSLRHEDHLKIGQTDFKVLLKPEAIAAVERATSNEDLTLLTAEELCDRILSEQSMVSEFVDGQRAGWENLLLAIETAHDQPTQSELSQLASIDTESAPAEFLEASAVASIDEQVTLNALLQQIQELNEAIHDRTRELTEQEKDVLESTDLLEDTHHRVTERLDDLLDQLSRNEPPSDLRASA